MDSSSPEPTFAELLAFAHDLAAAAGEAILPHFRSPLSVENKADPGNFDPVTIADRTAEEAMRELIRQRFPEHGIFGEEHGRTAGDRHTWVLDPIDGTRGFMTGLPTWGTLIGLTIDGQPRLGVMDQPFVGERFVGGAGATLLRPGAFAKPLHARACSGFAEAVLSTTSPDLFVTEAERAAFDGLRRQVRLTRYGGDCYAYCLLAAGLIDLVVESGLQPYDVVALVPIVEGAGGVITNWAGGPAWHGGQIVAAGDPRLHALALAALAPAVK